MKSFLASTLALMCLLPGFKVSAADRIVITGEPVVVREVQGIHVPTRTLIGMHDYYYLTIGGVNKICYEEVNPALADLNLGEYRVRLGGQVVVLHCYENDPRYFIIH